MVPYWLSLVLSLLLCAVTCKPTTGDDADLYNDIRQALELELKDEKEKSRAEHPSTGTLQLIGSWPRGYFRLGEVGGLAAGDDNDLYVFHRGKHTWDAYSFDRVDRYMEADEGPIRTPALIRLDDNGNIIGHYLANTFYMPHGLTRDGEGNFWMTDVALHQVFKYDGKTMKQLMVLGEKFVPGTDDTHFCKPTDVAVASNGDFFVADGYCNSRIIKFDQDGQVLKTWGRDADDDVNPKPWEFLVPHSVALLEEQDTICVADREHGRIQCFDAGLNDGNKTGEFKYSIHDPEFGKVFAISYDPTDDVLYAVNGITKNVDKALGFTVDMKTRNVIASWAPQMTGFNTPHDVTTDGNFVYVGEIGPNYVWKFKKM